MTSLAISTAKIQKISPLSTTFHHFFDKNRKKILFFSKTAPKTTIL